MKLDRIDRIFSALLRSDQEAGREVLSGDISAKLADELFERILTSGLPLLLARRLYQLGLSDRFQNVSLPSGRLFLTELNRNLAQFAARYMHMDEFLSGLLADFGELSERILLLKGAALSRYLYEEPSDRISADFDLLIEPAHLASIYNRLLELGFVPLWRDPGHCHQYLVGPTGTPEDLFILPNSELVPHNITMLKEGCPMLELKCDPLDMGLRFHEMDRLVSDSQKIERGGQKLLIPSDIDQLLLQLTHFHKHGLEGWAWLYDMQLLTLELAKKDGSWDEFIRRCRVEGISVSALLGLTEIIDVLGSSVPDSVLADLQKESGGAWGLSFARRIKGAFLWNCSNVFELIGHALFLGDSKRKFNIIFSCLFPCNEFIYAYYFESASAPAVKILWARLINFFVLIFPAGLSRRIFGRRIWGSAFGELPVDDC